jgi:SAM-dependent methyltransferase
LFGENKISTKKRDFDQEAAKWDQVPGRVKVARDIAQSILREIILTTDMDVLDFGCGTGLLTFALQPFVHMPLGSSDFLNKTGKFGGDFCKTGSPLLNKTLPYLNAFFKCRRQKNIICYFLGIKPKCKAS